jgi:hypothetical protein
MWFTLHYIILSLSMYYVMDTFDDPKGSLKLAHTVD